ncbi:FAD/NAD(P)-binding protein (plasmid) [Shinella sp. H4-D48]|uniref:FAD/NAD(P)-binding protein n=1 Tax=Shinella sp. H4-D48 TaxID=2925841 RepID=UPI001F5364B5|nr:FAD/NAD(P)-binding protein [Shinella sp. H4-D48]UNK40373.1 FAD/NAD(P)-binding protein [Shinella sp. H4-D48]
MTVPFQHKGPARPVVAIIGGGFTGAALAYHLAGLVGAAAVRIVVYEPRATLGGGLAYDTAVPVHRINVPASRMSLIPSQGEHFQDWLLETGALDDDAEATTPDGHVFARRSTFGRYVAAHLQPLLAAGAVEHHRARVVAIEPAGKAWRIEAEDGTSLVADHLVLATSHPGPQAPAAIERALAGHPRYVADATRPSALAAIRAHDRVLIVGTGLTAADIIAALDAAGHSGNITAVSRRGLRSRGHNLLPQEPFGEFVDPPSRTARALLRQVRRTIAVAEAHGVTWHAVFDRLRAQGGDIWRALPVAERRRLVRFLRPYWDVHRFRIAPQVEAAIEQRLSTGGLGFHAASLVSVVREPDDTIAVTFRPRRGGLPFKGRYNAVVLATGPGHGSILSSQPFLAGLAEAGVLKVDSVGLGIAVDAESRAIGEDGMNVGDIHVAGPLARGTFGELMGLPQVTEHAVFVAERVAAALARPASQTVTAGECRID